MCILDEALTMKDIVVVTVLNLVVSTQMQTHTYMSLSMHPHIRTVLCTKQIMLVGVYEHSVLS